MKRNTLILACSALVITLSLAACDHSNRTTNGTSDTSSVTKAGGPPITDTATVTANEKANNKGTAKKDSTAKGNVDPTGHGNK